jgi:hypothetical protein
MKLITPLRRPARLFAAVLLLAACSSGSTGAGWSFAPLGPTQPPSASPSGGSPSGAPSGSPTGNVIELEATADLRFKQGGQTVEMLELTPGEEYTVRVDNTAGFVHNIWFGPPDRLAARDHEGLPGIPDWESGVQEFSWTATDEAQGWEFACTVPGHYEAGMKGALMLGGGD